ncbi:phage recombination protein [Thermus phage MN1]|nr:phage recombination protein [Thermus phage MN1]
MTGTDLERLREVLDALAAPFPLEALGVKPTASNKDKTSVLAVAYVDARAVIDRLNKVVPLWEDRYTVLAEPRREGDPYVVECTLTIYPSPGGGGISRSDVGEGDTLKGAYSDALKRAAVKFGVGLYLYDLPQRWVPARNGFITDEGRAEVMKAWREYRPSVDSSGVLRALLRKAKENPQAVAEVLAKAETVDDIVARFRGEGA